MTESLERVGVSREWVTKSFERMQIFSNGLQTVVNGILLKNRKSLDPYMVTFIGKMRNLFFIIFYVQQQ